MKRFLCLCLAVLASNAPLQAQPQDQLRNFTNSLGMKFAWIPPGTFTMGSPKEEKHRQGHEDQHRVTLTRGFYMGVYPVTQEEWQTVMGHNPSYFKGERRLPVDNVSWVDCAKFIIKLRAKENRAYRLPTEAEWEYACRAGTTTPYYFGESISTDQVNFGNNFNLGSGANRRKTTPVGSFPANAWGLHDMHGNVWQWCQDLYGEYPHDDVVDPQGFTLAKGRIHMLRGGSWYNLPGYCRSACRNKDTHNRHNNEYGLRLCFFAE